MSDIRAAISRGESVTYHTGQWKCNINALTLWDEAILNNREVPDEGYEDEVVGVLVSADDFEDILGLRALIRPAEGNYGVEVTVTDDMNAKSMTVCFHEDAVYRFAQGIIAALEEKRART